MAKANDLRWSTLDEVYAAARAFLDPALQGGEGIWDSKGWLWKS